MTVDLGIPGLADVQEIGAGGNGVVFQARQVDLDRVVAIKMVHLSTSSDAIERFHRECRTMARIALHPGVAPIFASGTTESGKPYLIMPFYQAGSLADRVAGGPMPWADAVALMASVADAVQHAHDIDVVHRDLKPDNIMIDDRGQPVVVDFGIAKLVDTEHGQSTGIQLTPSYAPPEAFDGARPTRSYDIYSLGATLHALIAGDLPFSGDGGILALGMRKATEPPPNLRHLAPEAVCAAIEKAMAIDPSQRHATASEFAAAITAAAEAGGPVTGGPAPAGDPFATRIATEPPAAAAAGWAAPSGQAPSGPPPAVSQPGPYAQTPPPQVSQPGPYAQTPPPQSTPPPQVSQPGPYAQTPPQVSQPGPYAQTPPPQVSQPNPYAISQPGPYQQTGPQPFHAATATGPGATGSGGGSRSGLWIAVAAVVVLVGGIVGGVVAFGGGDDTATGTTQPDLQPLAPTVTEPDTGSASTDGSDTSEVDPGSDDATSGAVTARELDLGDCFDFPLTSGIFDTVDLRSCDEPHLAEVAAVFEHPAAGGAYPGIDELINYAFDPCTSAAANYIGTENEFFTELESGFLTPTFDEWDDGIFVIPCYIARWDGATVSRSLAGSGLDTDVILEFGDRNGLDRMFVGECFTEIGGDLLLEPLQQTVVWVDCANRNDGEVIGFVEIIGPDNGFYDFGAILDEGEAACAPVYEDYTGFILEEGSGLNAVIPSSSEWADQFRYSVCVILKVQGGEPGTLIDPNR